MMRDLVRSFDELASQNKAPAGGKGGTLAHLCQAGYPVPDGFVVLPAAFAGDELGADAWTQVQAQLQRLRNNGETAFAVRSSALSEDSAQASFAGEFETILDVRTDERIREAIHTVRRSRHSERVVAYSQAQGLDPVHEVAVVVQRLVRADVSGVLFTADPVSGSFGHMTGNFVYGLGEALVSGEAEPYTFTLARPRGLLSSLTKGFYEGPPALKRQANALYKLGSGLEDELGGPQDIEWAVAEGRLYLLQSRPITTLVGHNPATGEWNDSLRGDFIWTNVNVAEARPDVMTPLTWTLGQWLRQENQPLPGDYPWIGNIAGRNYMNLSLMLSMLWAMGINPKRMLKRSEDLFGPVPDGMEIPRYPFPLSAFFVAFPEMMRIRKRERQAAQEIPEFLATNLAWCREMERRIREAGTAAELAALWHEEIKRRFVKIGFMMGSTLRPLMTLNKKLGGRLRKLVGEADTNTLLSNLSSDSELLASMGPVVGIARVARGEMSRQEYLERYGHRGPHEMELSAPRPAEGSGWLDHQLAEFERAPVDVDGLLARRRAEFDAAWQRLSARHPRQAEALRPELDKVPPAARLREGFRSEMVRVYGVIRTWALRAGDLTGLGDDVFYLAYEELQDLLAGQEAPTAYIPARRETHARYCALPPLPAIIRGRFDPCQWAADPERRNDVYDARSPAPAAGPASDTIRGHAGAAGRVEGVVRRLDSFEEGDQLQPGEVLVAVTTNVGWTPLFPRAAAVITDVGAPLSHAAIVARELGIPAVVGCVDATTRLRTGDRVRVDGGQGLVEILENASA